MTATVCRLRHLLRPLISPLSPRSLFSSSSNHRIPPLLFSDDLKEQDTAGSLAYRHTLKTQRPSIIRWQKELENSASFIGRVYYPIKTFNSFRHGGLCAYTWLKVESPPRSHKSILILLNFWEDMADLCIQHLKINDHIYVSGYLRSYEKACDNGNIELRQKVIVKEINYVANNDQKTESVQDERESVLERERKRLHLWQVFFANPYEWRDSRKCKVNPRQPDFTHKGTGESLWLNPHDPPWVLRQLQRQDSKLGERGLFTSRSNLTKFTYNDI